MEENRKQGRSPWSAELELELEGIAQGGAGVGHYLGRTVFAEGGLPGERVRVQLYDRQRAFARGRVVELLRTVPARITSPCPFESRCGAGDWRWVDRAEQLRWKQTILHDQLTHLGGLALGELVIGATADPGDGWGYRTTAELHWAPGRGHDDPQAPALGYFVPGGREVADIPACCLHHPLLNLALAGLRPLLSAELPLRGVTVRCAPETGELMGVLDLQGAPGAEVMALAQKWQAAVPALVGVVATVRGTEHTLTGRSWLWHMLDGVRLRMSAPSFFQVNAHVTPLLIERVRSLLLPAPHERLLDLFCGVGTFALPLARQWQEVVGIESFAPAIADARASAQANGLNNTRWHVGTAEQVVPRLHEHYDGVVLDPPRRGCEPAMLDALLALRPSRIVYVACHPGTLARDCKQLVAGGYQLSHAEVIDLFPQTHHVESIVRLHL
ncbi:MAG: 23S rRNA (uracil(1939)-C(5))-methyltransferase RlmD [Herpetosiphonaceae bacterium]|nr:23S rRNA (uracil(1939)-C(5))-methyltransferase RlmD [Herpetosiphonaceae bacterium]